MEELRGEIFLNTSNKENLILIVRFIFKKTPIILVNIYKNVTARRAEYGLPGSTLLINKHQNFSATQVPTAKQAFR